MFFLPVCKPTKLLLTVGIERKMIIIIAKITTSHPDIMYTIDLDHNLTTTVVLCCAQDPVLGAEGDSKEG